MAGAGFILRSRRLFLHVEHAGDLQLGTNIVSRSFSLFSSYLRVFLWLELCRV